MFYLLFFWKHEKWLVGYIIYLFVQTNVFIVTDHFKESHT